LAVRHALVLLQSHNFATHDRPALQITHQTFNLKHQSCHIFDVVEFGQILRRRIAQKDQPRSQEVIAESEATKVHWGQWHSLIVLDGVLCRKAKRHYISTTIDCSSY